MLIQVIQERKKEIFQEIAEPIMEIQEGEKSEESLIGLKS